MTLTYAKINKLILAGFIIMLIGFSIIFLWSIFQYTTKGNEVSVSGGILFIFGFIPVGVAFGPYSELIMIFLFILAIIVIFMMFILRKSF